MQIDTVRTRLRSWREDDKPAFAAMNHDPDVMQDLGGPIGRAASDAKLDRYRAVYDRYGLSRWVVESRDGVFLGTVGILPVAEDYPLAADFEIGWRFVRAAWGHGYATEAAAAALEDAFLRVGLMEIVSFTALDNLRSQRVMTRLGLRRDSARDFTVRYDGLGSWHGLVWVAGRPQS